MDAGEGDPQRGERTRAGDQVARRGFTMREDYKINQMKKKEGMFANIDLQDLLPKLATANAQQGQTVIDLQNKQIKNLSIWIRTFTPSAIREALLSHNDLSSIDALDRFKELRRIIANNNYISKVRLSLDRLETLDLSNNAITSVPNLAAMPRLKVLNLVSNSIRQVDVDFLPLAESLEKLYLAQNEIEFYSRGTMRAWVANMKKMNKLEDLTVKANPFVEEFTNYKSLLFEGVKSLDILDGERRREAQKNQSEMGKADEEEDELLGGGKQTKGGAVGAKRLVHVTDLESVFNMLLHSVEMINYDRAHALN